MPSREELYNALRNADKAGDTEGAKRLAAYIRSMPSDASASETKEKPGMISSGLAGAGKGLGDVVLGAQSLVGKGLRAAGATGAGNWLVNDAEAGRARLAQELQPYKDANPISAGAGELGGNVIATLPVGGAIGRGITAAAPALSRLGVSSDLVSRLASSVSTAGMRTGAPAAASLGGRAADIGLRSAGGAITGGASAGLINTDDAASGALVGAALPPALSAAGKGAAYVGNVSRALVQPFTEKGQQLIAANILRRFGEGGPMAINANEIVPGSLPTLAEATGNAGIAGLQRAGRDLRPNAFVAREELSAGARNALFDNVAGDAGMVAAARKTRDDTANALYGQAFTADRMRQTLANESQRTRAPFSGVGLSAAREDLATPGLRALAARPMFREAINEAKRLSANNGSPINDPLQSLEGLHYIKLALDDALSPTATTSLGRNAKAAVMDMRDSLTKELAEVAPLYGVGRQRFAEMSQPINAMESLQDLKLTDAKGNITLAKVKNSIERLERVRREPGIDPAKSITEEQMKSLYAIQDDLLRKTNTDLGRSAGSNTFQNISTNNLLASLIPGRMGAIAQDRAGGAVGQLGRLAYSGPNEAIQNRLADMFLDPALAQQALALPQGYSPQSVQAILNLLAPATYRAGPLIGVSPEEQRNALAKSR